jgi:hypothetical protein
VSNVVYLPGCTATTQPAPPVVPDHEVFDPATASEEALRAYWLGDRDGHRRGYAKGHREIDASFVEGAMTALAKVAPQSVPAKRRRPRRRAVGE